MRISSAWSRIGIYVGSGLEKADFHFISNEICFCFAALAGTSIGQVVML